MPWIMICIYIALACVAYIIGYRTGRQVNFDKSMDIAYMSIEIQDELDRADEKHGPMLEEVEGLHTLKCEIAELEREIMRKAYHPKHKRKEAIQVAAMAYKFLRDCC